MKHPNIIVINPDEMRWDSMGHLGNPAASTPVLDRFAQTEAVSFRRAYCQNPVCVPSRCSFFTGLYPHVHGHRTMQYLLHEEEPSLFSELKEAGYYVWMNSRNDLLAGQITGLAEHHASEIYYYDNTKKSVKSELTKGNAGRGTENQKEKDFPYSHFKGLEDGQGDFDWADTEAACERILHPVEPGKPLCLFLGWVNPHPPYQVEKTYYSRIDKNKVPPPVCAEECSGKSLMLQKLQELSGMKGYTQEQWRELRTVYLAQCAKVDAMFQAVCQALKEAGIYDDSAIFFLSDHGDFCGDYDLPEKAQNTFEDCLVRVPLLIKPPKYCCVDPGVTDSVTELVDFYATAMDYAGVSPSHDHFGRTLRPIVEDRDRKVRNYVCCEGGRLPHEEQCDEWHAEGMDGPAKSNAYWPKKTAQLDDAAHEKGTMIFDGRYKYIHRPSGRDELYDLKEDAGEQVNRFADRCLQPQVQRLQMAMLNWYQQTCDIVPRSYDNRFTQERIWASIRNICPPELKGEMRDYLRRESPSIMQAVQYIMARTAQNEA